MSFLVRKINRGRWGNLIHLKTCADAITHDLKTHGNTLSFWEIKSLNELDKALIALSTSHGAERVGTLCYVVIPKEEITKKGLSLNQTTGDTVVTNLESIHMDVVELNYDKLGLVNDIIRDHVDKNKDSRIVKSKLLKLLKEKSIKNCKSCTLIPSSCFCIDFNKLHESLRKKLEE